MAETSLPLAPAVCWGELSSWCSAPSPKARPVPSCLVLADKEPRKAMGSRRGWNRTQLAGQRDRGVRTDSQPRAGGVLAGGRDRSCPGAAQPPRWVRAHQLSPCGQKTKETAPKPGWELALLPGAVQRGGCGAAVTSARPGASREAAQAVASLGPASPAVVGRRFICAAMLGQTRNGPTCAGQARGEGRAASPACWPPFAPGSSPRSAAAPSSQQGASRPGGSAGKRRRLS